ncbi:MAG: hypothetical protein U1A25_02690 [Candidatus Sungbacteria bacterium]|nr:hypothetical protein [bacterium]MDZ4260549.1 hypothetical protein [Candidatus Sungbacteria bacterium]
MSEDMIGVFGYLCVLFLIGGAAGLIEHVIERAMKKKRQGISCEH